MPPRPVTNNINTSEWNLNQSSERETPRSCCYFLNTFIECHFFPTLPFPLLNFHTMSLLWPSPDMRTTKDFQLDPVLVSAAAKVKFFLTAYRKSWREGRKRKSRSLESQGLFFSQGFDSKSISFALSNYSLSY
jgi:hypothetical protein